MEMKEVKTRDVKIWQRQPLNCLLDNIEHVLKVHSVKRWGFRDSQYGMLLGTFLDVFGLFGTTKESLAVVKLFYETIDKGDEISKIKDKVEKLKEYRKAAEEQVKKAKMLKKEFNL